MADCSFCGKKLTPGMEKTSTNLFGKPVCTKPECEKKANDEAAKATEALMTPQDKVRALLVRQDFEEQSIRGFFISDNGSTKIAVDLNKISGKHPGTLIPQVGVLRVNGDIQEDGHGLTRIDDLRREIEGILKSKGAGNSKKETPAPEPVTPTAPVAVAPVELVIPANVLTALKNHAWVVEKGTAAKIIDEKLTTIDLSKIEQRGKATWVEGVAYEFEQNNVIDAELKILFGELSKAQTPAARNGVEKPEPRVPVSKEGARMPARQETSNLPGKPLSDAERDAQIEDAKAKRFLEHRGAAYKVQGKERPDAHQIQRIANERGISLEILSTAHTEIFVEVRVRGHLRDQYCDAVVHHEFKDEYMLKTMEVIYKNPGILDHWEGTEPVIKEGAMITIKEDGREIQKDAKYFIVHSLLTWKKFAMRDARTKAGAIAEAMLLNQDFREPEEKQSEEAEAALVQEDRKRRGI